jgi:hypothetical protein
MINFGFGFVTGTLITAATIGFLLSPALPPELELEAYQLCMQSASTTRCQMTPQDFVRYYELKHQLENDNGEK